MYQTINFGGFCDAFRAQGREDQFSYPAKWLLYDYLEEVEPDLELDVVALCCAYTEAAPEDVIRDYGLDAGLHVEELRDWLQDRTGVCGITPDGAIVYCSEF